MLALAAVIAYVVSAPLRGGRAGRREAEETAEHAEWTAARDAKYSEIRDAELDFRTGKLSAADWKAQDRTLRAEAIVILRRLDALEGREEGGGGPLS